LPAVVGPSDGNVSVAKLTGTTPIISAIATNNFRNPILTIT
jgi:hypothetical protein